MSNKKVYALMKVAAKKKEDNPAIKKTPDGPKRILHDWRRMYTAADLAQAERFIEKGQYSGFMVGDHFAKARIGNSTSGFQAEIDGEADSYSHGWDPEWLNCTCVKGGGQSSARSARSYYYGSYYGSEKRKQPCSHTAALFMLWEKQHGAWEYEETEAEKKERLDKEERERLRREAEEREREEKKWRLELKKQEMARRAEQKRLEGGEKCSGKDFLNAYCKYGTNCFFDVKKIASQVKTNHYEVHRAQKLLPFNRNTEIQVELKYGKEGSQQLSATATVKDEVIQGDSGMPSMILSRDRMAEHKCNCGSVVPYWFYNSSFDQEFCAHELVLLCRLNEYINQNNPGDATDLAAFRFFESLEKASSVQEEASKQGLKTKEKNLVLQPLLTLDGGVNPRLSFRIGFQGGKLIILKNLRGLQDAYEQEELFSPSKTVQIDFSRMDFDEESQPWLTFILHRISDTDHINHSMNRNSWYSVQVSVQNNEVLEGALLDRFYDTAEGKICCLQNKSAHNGISSIRVGHKNMQVSITSDEIRDSGDKVIGVELKGIMPVILKGAGDGYILDEHALSRISKEEEMALRPFRSAADAYGNICFRVGKDRLAEFYYRVVPELMGKSFIDFRDHVADKIASLLPPEPEFTFRLDLEENRIFCAGEVAYAGKKNALKDNNPGGGYRDVAQEKRVEKAIERYFPETAQQAGLFSCVASEEEMYQVLQYGIAELSKYGTVLGSEQFQKLRIRKTPQFQLGISVESGILDLELLSVGEDYDSYRFFSECSLLRDGFGFQSP